MFKAGFGDGRGVMSNEDVASAKSAKSVGEVNSSSSSRWMVIGLAAGGYVEWKGRDVLEEV